MAFENEIRLEGGNLTPVIRVCDTVRRTAGPWTPIVHELLRHVRERGFQLAPEPLGIDEQGREVLSYIEGDTLTSQPWPMWIWSDQLLIEAAQTLADYHAAVADFRPTAVTSRFGTLPLDADEIVCHNDFAPYNTVFVAGRIAGIIDWDLVTPADPLWDLAFVAWQWIPLYPPSDEMACRTPDECARRLRLLIDNYDGDVGDGFVDLVIARIDTSRRGILQGAALGDEAFVRLERDGQVAEMDRTIAFVESIRPELIAALRD